MIVNLSAPQNNFFERTDTFKRYCEDIRNYSPLTFEKEQELIKKYHTTKNDIEKHIIREQIICANQRFILGVVKRWATNDNLLDLISEANIGMTEALDEYDIEQNVRFITFAVYYIRRSINTYISKNGEIVRKTDKTKINNLINQITNNFMQKEYRQPTIDEIAEILENEYDVSLKDCNDILKIQVSSIDDDYGCEEEDTNVGALFAYNRVSATFNESEKNTDQEFAKKMVQSVLKKLTENEQEVVKYLFGIGHYREYELNEIAEKLDFTSERIRQLKISALEKMKNEYGKLINTI